MVIGARQPYNETPFSSATAPLAERAVALRIGVEDEMTTLGLILREMAHRKVNFLLSVLAIATAIALFAAFLTTAEASKRETTRIMRDLGLNLRILPAGTEMTDFFHTGFSHRTMPESNVDLLCGNKVLPMWQHPVAVLLEEVTWRDRPALLTGISEEHPVWGQRKPPMIHPPERGTVRLGFELADRESVQADDQIAVEGKSFTVASCERRTGTRDDIRIYADLRDVQELRGKQGKINEIWALECPQCVFDSEDELVAKLRGQIEKVLPEAKLVRHTPMADARVSQRQMVKEYFAMGIPFVLVVCAAWVGLLAMMNVRQRRQEIGVLRALGYRSSKIASLFLGKALVVGLLGALMGFGIGTGLALLYGPDVFKVTAKMIKPSYTLFGWLLVAAPAFAAVASLIPTVVAVTQDPAVTLRED